MIPTTTQNKKRSLGGFYQVSKGAIQEVAKQGNAKLVLAYLALRHHQQPDDPEKHTSIDMVCAGRPAIFNTLGETSRHADKLMNQLREIRWGDSQEQTALVDVADWNEGRPPQNKLHSGRYSANKVMPAYGDDYICLPNQLNQVHTGQQYSPLGQIYNEVVRHTRLPAIMLLLGLYEHLDMKNYGGADPTQTMFIRWRRDGEVLWDGIELMTLGSLGRGSTGLYYWAVDTRSEDEDTWDNQEQTTHWAFINSITDETKETGADKFWAAWRALNSRGLVNHAAMVFDANPLEDDEAETLYPLWIFNRKERERFMARGSFEGGLAQEAFNSADRALEHGDEITESMKEVYSVVASTADGMIEHPTGFYVFAARNPEADVMGVMRPRFIPNNMDSQAGWAINRDKAENWATILNAN